MRAREAALRAAETASEEEEVEFQDGAQPSDVLLDNLPDGVSRLLTHSFTKTYLTSFYQEVLPPIYVHPIRVRVSLIQLYVLLRVASRREDTE